ncbi:MAG: phage shock protein C [Thermoproteota archaeon]|jgi:phage shock protein C
MTITQHTEEEMIVEVNKTKIWKRSSDGWLGGVCEGIADSTDTNANLIRLAWVSSILLFGIGIVLYIAAAFILPLETEMESYQKNKILGVCKRISQRSGVELGIVRLITFFICFGSGVGILVYFLLHFILEPTTKEIRY